MPSGSGLETGQGVWIPCKDEVWRSGIVTGFTDEGLVIVEVKAKPSLRSARPERVEVPWQASKAGPQILPRNEALKTREGALSFKDLSHLPLLHEPAILHALQVRFEDDVVYTNTGPVLIAVNPFKTVPNLYGKEKLLAFAEMTGDAENAEPHCFGVARAAYQGIRRRGAHQTVLVSGESGAGKTETTKFVMRFLALAGTGSHDEASMSEVERKVLESIPVLEALGNAKTLRNDNSSRFGKYIELQFSRPLAEDGVTPSSMPRMVGAHTHTYLLEKVRVVGQQEGERSFHIFYQVLAAAASRKLAAARGVSTGAEELRGATGFGPSDFAYLRQSKCTNLGDEDEAQSFNVTLSAMRAFGIKDEEASSLIGSLMAVLHVGNVQFVAPANNSEGSEPSKTGESGIALQKCCELLGVDEGPLCAAWCKKSMKAPGEGVIFIPATCKGASEGRDALARHLYAALFAFVVERINAVVSSDRGEQLPVIGVLDIFGFEFFLTNSLEQLFINFTNELLQQYFNEVIFDNETLLYEREGIEWNPLDFPDNKDIVDLLGKAPAGVLPMLDEECMVVGGSSEQWSSKLQKAHNRSRHFDIVKQRQHNFVIKHFAGPVEYFSQAFLDKNRDALGADLVNCLKGSRSEFLQQRFGEHDRTFGTQESVSAQTGARRNLRAKKYTVASEFRGQLGSLMERIRATEPHFVRCLKPNPKNQPSLFDRPSVVQQLQYQGVLQAIEVSRAGFPMRLKHRQGLLNFRCIAPLEVRLQLEAHVARGAFAAAARMLFEGFARSAALGLAAGTWSVGATLIFLKREGVEALSKALTERRSEASIEIQAFQRRAVAQRGLRRARAAAVSLQTAIRGLLARRRAVTMRRSRAVLRLQCAARGHAARRAHRRRFRAVQLLQAWIRSRRDRNQLLRIISAGGRLARWWRRASARMRVKRIRQSVLLVQRVWRGSCGRAQARVCLAQEMRLKRAAAKLLRRWRERVCDRLVEPVTSMMETHPMTRGCTPGGPEDTPRGVTRRTAAVDALAARLAAAWTQSTPGGRPVSDGALVATAAALRQRSEKLATEAAVLKREGDQLRLTVSELRRWTALGMVRQVATTFFGNVCAEAADDPLPHQRQRTVSEGSEAR